MEFKKLILILAITATIVFGCLWGGTYAYYTYSGGTSLNVTTGNVNTGVVVVFNQSEYMNVKTGVPIAENDVDAYASKTVFTLKADSSILNGYDVAVSISLINFKIDNDLLVNDLRYDFSCNDGTTTKTLVSGSGNYIDDNIYNSGVLPLGTLATSDGSFNINKTYTCTFRVWLQETGSDQNHLMNKNLSGIVRVNSVFRKQ